MQIDFCHFSVLFTVGFLFDFSEEEKVILFMSVRVKINARESSCLMKIDLFVFFYCTFRSEMAGNNNPQMIFSEEEKEILVDYVRANPALYSIQHKAYKNIELKNRLWETIGKKLNRSGK